MALEAEKLRLREDIPAGEMASKVIKAVHQDTRRRMFAKDTLYGREGGERRSLKKSIVVYLSPETRDNKVLRIHVPKQKPIEKRDFSNPCKAFRSWVIPGRFSSCERERPNNTPKPPQRSLSALTSTSRTSKRTDFSGKVESPKISTSTSRQDKVVLPRLNKTPECSTDKPKVPRTYSAAQQYVVKYYDQDKNIKQVLTQYEQAKIDQILRNIHNIRIRENLRQWFVESSPRDKNEAIKLLLSCSEEEVLGKKGSHDKKNNRLPKLLEILTDSSEKEKEFSSLPIQDLKRKRRVKLLSAATRMRMGEFQTWHHMPGQPIRSRVENTSSMYFTPKRVPPVTFRIHPEWT